MNSMLVQYILPFLLAVGLGWLILRFTGYVVSLVTPQRRIGLAFSWIVSFALFALFLWHVFVPRVRFRVDSVSLDGRTRLCLEDITTTSHGDAWRVRARMEDALTGSRIGRTKVISYWNSSFDNLDREMPAPEDIEVRWDGCDRTASVRLGGSWWLLPGGEQLPRNRFPFQQCGKEGKL